jgi:Na+/phosphate symporter
LKEIIHRIHSIFEESQHIFRSKEFSKLESIIRKKRELLELVDQKIEKQVKRTKNSDESPKNTTLYFGLLLETRDLMNVTTQVAEQYFTEYDSNRFEQENE